MKGKSWFWILSVALVAFVVVLAACGAEATPTPTPRPPTPTPVPAATATPTPRPATPTPAPLAATPTPAPPTSTPRPSSTPSTAATPTRVPPTATPTPVPPTPTPAVKKVLAGLPPSSTMSDAEWAKVVEAAKKEGKVMIYQWESRFWRPEWAVKEFEKLYGIKVETLSLSSSWTVERIASEARASIYTADIVNIVGTYYPKMEKQGWLSRIDSLPALKDVTNPDLWYASPIRTPYYLRSPAIRTDVYDYNYSTKVVPPERLPKKPQDLLDPWWKETKICNTDPAGSNAPNLVFWRVWRGMGMGGKGLADWYPEYFYDLASKASGRLVFSLSGTPSPMIRGDCGTHLPFYGMDAGTLKKDYNVDQQAPWIAGGNFDSPIPVYGLEQAANGLLAKAPHPNAALVFLNWRFTKEGQDAWAKNSGSTVALRKDVASPIEDKYKPAKSKAVTYFWTDEPEWSDFEEYTGSTRMILQMEKEGMSKAEWLKKVKDASMSFWGQYPPPAPGYFPY